MIVAHNLIAMNAERQLGLTSKTIAKSSEKLSSGYKINRAADDASGLAISEKMRKKIRSLKQGMDNISDGISLCNVADGAMDEVHDMLDRMVVLAVKSANGTNSESDRRAIDDEVQELKKEIDRIGLTTKFNDELIFRGTKTTYQGHASAPTANSAFFKLLGNDVSHTGYMQEPLDQNYLDTLTKTDAHNQGDNPYVSVHIDFEKVFKNDVKKLNGTEFYVNCCTNCCPTHVKFSDTVGISKKDTPSGSADEVIIGLKKTDGSYYSSAEEFCKAIVEAHIDGNHVEYACDGSKLYLYDVDNNNWSEDSKQLAYFCDFVEGKTPPTSSYVVLDAPIPIRIQMSDEVDDHMVLEFGELSTEFLKLDEGNCLTMQSSLDLIDSVAYANYALSSQRSRIGAYVNRLEHSYANIANIHENTSAAESAIRDTDMATEMVKYSNHNIVSQAGQAMLAQANQSNQGVLPLLG